MSFLVGHSLFTLTTSIFIIIYIITIQAYSYSFTPTTHSTFIHRRVSNSNNSNNMSSSSSERQSNNRPKKVMKMMSSSSTLSSHSSSILTSTSVSSSSASTSTSASTTKEQAQATLQTLANEMNERAKNQTPLTENEMRDILASFENVSSTTCTDTNTTTNTNKDYLDEEGELSKLLSNAAHLSHKDWTKTGNSAQLLRDFLLKDNPTLTPEFKQMFQRVIKEGNWENALQHASSSESGSKPWVVLVTGVNGIRKTTSVYQSWFNELLQEALVVPPGGAADDDDDSSKLQLPTGENSFFRQLDHMIATLTNHNFQLMYHLTSQAHDFHNDNDTDTDTDENTPSSDLIQTYSNYKAAIFTRYRTLSEILGVMLVREAIQQNLNVMIETSGRDVAMFHYVDLFFPSDKYNKLALHFTINDLSHAESSVDKRMVREMKDGSNALQSSDIVKIIKANAGGPYGSEVLKGIQKDSDAVWDTILANAANAGGDGEEKSVGHDWFKATIHIEASGDKDWTAKAIRPDGTDGQAFTFEAPRKV
mmetsp:Transcript_25910/g.31940  ORF Transcript_25910/g.31940 Transcript_25910/m.31940 type:complete len:535 (-) Transcript_25910:160-1764(-)